MLRIIGAVACLLGLSSISPALHAQDPALKRNPAVLIVPEGTMATTYNWPSAEGNRDVIVFRPTERAGSGDLIVVNHALAMNAVSMANLTDFGSQAASTGAIVVFTTGIAGRFNVDLDPSTDLDVEHLTDVLERAVTMFGVNPARRFMAGYSNGAIMTAIVACRRPELLAGIGLVAGTLDVATSASCTAKAGDLSVITFHGTNDRIISYTGARTSMGALPVYDFFHTVNECVSTLPPLVLPNQELLNSTTVEMLRSNGCANGTVVQHFKITRGGHAWPDSNFAFFNLQSGTTTRDVNATEEIGQFFAQAPSKKATGSEQPLATYEFR